MSIIDLRSDTCTKPTAKMRAAMSEAEVGNDGYSDDPTVNRLESRTAELLGKEAAVYMPSGTMTNQVALRAHTEAGDEIITEAGAHIYLLESGAPAALSGLMIRHIPGHNGIFDASQLSQVLRAPSPTTTIIYPPTKLVCIENTHNVAGGTVWPLDTMRAVTETARANGIATHLDGARLWNASAKTGIPDADYAAGFDSVSVCFSKGLGAPVGSALAGSRAFIERARRFRRMFGGSMRQAGIVAAGALYALDHHRARLVEDHDSAAHLAQGLADLPGISLDLETVETNIVRFEVTSMPANTFSERCAREDVLLSPTGPSQLRVVTHLDISSADIDRALEVIAGILSVPQEEAVAAGQ